MKDLPNFQTIEEAVSFWETHDSADFWDEMEEIDFDVELRQSILTAKPIILAYRPDDCPRCGAGIQDSRIEYLVDDGGHLLMIRDLPVLGCEGEGHLYMLEETFDKVQQLIALDRLHKVKSTTTLTIPVFEFVAE